MLQKLLKLTSSALKTTHETTSRRGFVSSLAAGASATLAALVFDRSERKAAFGRGQHRRKEMDGTRNAQVSRRPSGDNENLNKRNRAARQGRQARQA